MSVVLVSDVAGKLGKTFSEEEAAQVQQDIDALRDELENKLHATIERRERTEYYEASVFGSLHLLGPIIRIIQVIKVGATTDSTYVRGLAEMRDTIYPSGARAGDMYEVTYEAGGMVVDNAVRRLVMDNIIRNEVVGVHVSSGAYSSLNVEGASVGFGPAVSGSSDTQEGSFTATELKRVAHLKRRIIL